MVLVFLLKTRGLDPRSDDFDDALVAAQVEHPFAMENKFVVDRVKRLQEQRELHMGLLLGHERAASVSERRLTQLENLRQRKDVTPDEKADLNVEILKLRSQLAKPAAGIVPRMESAVAPLTKGAVSSSDVSEGKGSGLSDEDRAAIHWALDNPNDARAAEIMKQHGY